jgi:hypothetical protein
MGLLKFITVSNSKSNNSLPTPAPTIPTLLFQPECTFIKENLGFGATAAFLNVI